MSLHSLRELNMATVSTPIRVRYSEVDSMKWANHGAYARWFEVGRAELMRKQGLTYKALEEMGYYLPITEMHCKYLKPIIYDDYIQVATTPSAVKKASMRFEYELSKDGTVMARGYTSHVCLDENARIVRIPEPMLRILL